MGKDINQEKAIVDEVIGQFGDSTVVCKGRREDNDRWVYGYFIGPTFESEKNRHRSVIISVNNDISYKVKRDTVVPIVISVKEKF
jgi:hypothetical protein